MNLALLASTQTLTIQDNSYTFGFGVGLSNSTWYILRLESKDAQTQTGGLKDPVKLYTLSSQDTNAVVYDENPSFAEMMLTASPPTSIGVLINSNQNTKYYPNEIIDLEITIQPKINITGGDIQVGFKLLVLINDKDYNFMPLESQDQPCTFQQCTCHLQQNEISIACSNDLLIPVVGGLQLKVITKIRTSKHIKSTNQATSISVYSIFPTNNQILEQGIVLDQFGLQKITVSNLKLELLWGVPYLNSDQRSQLVTKQPVPIALYKPATTGFRGIPYNNVKVKFMLNFATPADQELIIEINVADADSLLESSFTHNLPAISSSVVCYFSKVIIPFLMN